MACESLIQSLFSNLGAYEKEYKDLYVNEAKAEQAINRINSILRRLGYGGLEEVNIEDFRIAVSRKERIRTLYKSYGIIKETIKDTNKRLHNLELAAESKHSEWQSLGEVKDIGTLKLVLDHVKIEGNIENTITVLTQELKELLEVTKEELKFLPLWEGSVEEFESFYVPILEETILQYMEQLDRINEERANLGRTIKLEKTNIQEAEKSIADLEAISVIPTEDDLEISRHIRNQGWEIIKKKLKGESVEKKLLEDYRNELEVEEKFEQDLRKTDEISDIMWRESAKVGMKDKSLQDIERSKSKISEAEKQLELFENELIQFNQQWKELWAPFNINPLTPAEMKEWVRKYKIIKQNQAEYKKKQHLWTELTETRTAVLGRLFGALSEVSKIDTGLSEWTLADLIREAKSFINSETERINEKKSLEKEWLGKVSDLEQVKNELKIKQQELINWKTMWEEAISPLQLNNEATIDYTLEILDIYDQLTITYDEWCDINTKVQASKSYVKEYLDHIQRVASILQEPDPIDIQSYVHQLSNNLQEHKKAKQNQTEWHEQLRKRKNEYTFAKEKKKLAENRLHELLKTAGVATIEEMLIIEEKSGQKQKLVGEITHLEKLLLEIGNGLSIEEIKKEIDRLDLDFIESEMAELKAELVELEDRRAEQNQRFGVCKKEYEDKIKGNSLAAVQAAEERESVLAELAEYTEQYVQKKLAAFVLQKGIEYFRTVNQNPILTRASILFSSLTLNSFDGLIVDYNEKDEEVLLGLKNNEKIGIEAMSDGTKDQLYLSLRVASIEKYCEENEPIPFIVDDILVHFDNERSKITLSILKELSKKTQIIFFTHHYHLIQLLEETLNEEDYQIVHIHKEAVMT